MSVMKQYKDVFIAFEEGEPSYECVTDGYRTINKLNILNDENNVFNIPDLAPEYKPQKEEMHTVNMLRDCLSGVDVGIVVFPKVNFFKTMKLYANELKSTQGDAKDKYKTIMQEYKGHSSNIFYTYFIPTNLNVFAIKLTRTLGLKLKGVDLDGNCLIENIKELSKLFLPMKSREIILKNSNEIFFIKDFSE